MLSLLSGEYVFSTKEDCEKHREEFIIKILNQREENFIKSIESFKKRLKI